MAICFIVAIILEFIRRKFALKFTTITRFVIALSLLIAVGIAIAYGYLLIVA
ncbi:MAG: hypothetical protein HY606_15185 [Planctomycetes bacterium]|nr:hypothetical protein [Planctomycetota bacterium]